MWSSQVPTTFCSAARRSSAIGGGMWSRVRIGFIFSGLILRLRSISVGDGGACPPAVSTGVAASISLLAFAGVVSRSWKTACKVLKTESNCVWCWDKRVWTRSKTLPVSIACDATLSINNWRHGSAGLPSRSGSVGMQYQRGPGPGSVGLLWVAMVSAIRCMLDDDGVLPRLSLFYVDMTDVCYPRSCLPV
jgi:hypothetical protein